MSRDRQTLLVLLLSALYALAVKFGEDRGYIPAWYNAVNYIVLAAMLIFLAVQVRRGGFAMPTGLSVLRVRGPILFGLVLVLASIVWFAFGFVFLQSISSYATLIPFFVLFLGGLMIAIGGLCFKFLQLMLGK
jgi:hypothetical protein